MKDNAIFLRATLGAALLVSACGGGEPTQPSNPDPPGPPPVASVEVSPPSSKLAPQQTVQLSAVARDASGSTLTGRTITWTSAQGGVASVSNTGLVTAVAPGTATISATSEGKSANAQITVEAPVATVEVTAPATTLVPTQTVQLSATMRDAGGAALPGRTATWASSQASVATVSTAGLVTALAEGSTTITATSEGQNGTVVLTVIEGAVVGSGGGTLTFEDGDLLLTVPPGAVSAETPITVTPISAPSDVPPADWQVVGSMYRLGLSGAVLTQPVTVTIKLDPASLPGWAMTGDLAVLQAAAGSWGALSDVQVDTAARTVSGQFGAAALLRRLPARGRGGRASGARMAGAGPALRRAGGPGTVVALDETGDAEVGVGVRDASVSLTPAAARVNPQHRSAFFHASVVPNGEGVSRPAPSSTETPQWKYRWRTTGQHGTLAGGVVTTGWVTSADMQYIATSPVLNSLPPGPIDQVFVDILLNPAAENGPPGGQRIVTAQANVTADLELTYDVAPDFKTIGPGESANFQLLIRNKEGAVLTPDEGFTMTWDSEEFHGSIGTPMPDQTTITYAAKTVSELNTPPPRVDEIRMKIENVRIVQERSQRWDFNPFEGPPKLVTDVEEKVFFEPKGEAKAFVTVEVQYQVKLEPASSTLTPGGTRQLVVTLDPPYNGSGLAYKFTNTGNHGTLDVGTDRVLTSTVTYTANTSGPSGTDQISVTAVSVVAQVEVGSFGTGQATIEVNALAGTVVVEQDYNGVSWYTAAQIRIPKIPGATQYEVKAEQLPTNAFPTGTYERTFSGATHTMFRGTVFEVLDGGSHWRINIEGGFNTIGEFAAARQADLTTRYAGAKVTYKVQP